MEAITQGVDDHLIGNLSYKLAPGASYVTDRRASTFHTTGSNVYSPTGTKLVKIMLTGDYWLDPSTVRIMFDLYNDDATSAKLLRPLGGPWSFFQRMRILVGGQVVEDVDTYNRVHEMFSILTATDSRENVDAEGFDVPTWDMFKTFSKDYNAATANLVVLDGIEGGGAKHTVLFKPLSGLFNQSKYLPLKYCGGITIELEVVGDATEPIVSHTWTTGTGNTGVDLATNTSVSWHLENVQCKCDLVTLDNSLENSYAEHLLSGKTLPVNLNTFISQSQTVSGSKLRVNVNRSLSRLKSVFVTLSREHGAGENLQETVIKSWNNFYSPKALYMDRPTEKTASGEISNAQIQIGSKLFPEYPIRSHNEAYYQLRKTLGIQSSSLHSFDIKGYEYRTRKFIMGIDTEKVLEAGFTGMNTRANDMLSVRFEMEGTLVERQPDQLFAVLHADIVLQVADNGVSVLD